MLPMEFADAIPGRLRAARAMRLLDQVGIAQHAGKFPAALSGGEQQRAAIARAQANDPPVLLADEPTGNLDAATSDTMLRIFRDLAAASKTVVMVTHAHDVSRWVTRTVTLADGRLVCPAPEASPAGNGEAPDA